MSRMRCTKKRVFKLRHNTERDEQTYIHTDRQTDTSGPKITFERASLRRYTGSTRTTLVVGSIINDASIPCDGIAVYLQRIHQTGDVVGVGAKEIAGKVLFRWTRFASPAQINGDHVEVIAHELRLELRREIKHS